MTRPVARQPLPHEAARPFDYAQPTPDEMSAAIGSTNWCLARRGRQIVDRYGPDVVCLSQAKYAAAEARAIELRGWARPCELVLRIALNWFEAPIPHPVTAVHTHLHAVHRKQAVEALHLLLSEAKRPR
jgi:hypothetical protein